MRVLEFGDNEKEIIILIHGVNIPWKMWEKEIEFYSREYHVLVPALSGHDAEENTQFRSVEDEAKEIKKYVIENYGTAVYMVIGMSMGAAIAFCLLADGLLHAKYLVFDSGVFVATSPFLLSINKKMQLCCKNKTKQRDAKILAKLNKVYGSTLAPHYIEMADKMSDDNLLAALNSIGNFKMSNELRLSNTKIIAFHGTVFMEIQAKKSANYLKKNFPQAYIKVLKGYNHGELSVNRPDEFVHLIEQATK